MTLRRKVVSSLVALAGLAPWLGVSRAAPARNRPPRIGRLAEGGPGDLASFRSAMRAVGYPEVAIEDRPAQGQAARLPALAAELVALDVDVIWSVGSVASAAAKEATRTIPVVIVSADAVGAGLISSLARPGGNLTGLSLVSTDLVHKRLELMVQLDRRIRRVVALSVGPDSLRVPFVVEWLRQSRAAAAALRVPLTFVDLPPEREDWDAAFASLASVAGTALSILESPYLIGHRVLIAELAAKHRLPAVYAFQSHVLAGGLMSYGVTTAHINERVAYYIARILDGAKPGDLPVEQPTKFELAINLKAAQALGLAVPAALRLRADLIID